ncbi:MAG TPA: hypothetical protein VFV02_08520, partial [Acidimicrobiales bacterium]|nr:hypothetical protein [Acidimicrobiales bacterium]
MTRHSGLKLLTVPLVAMVLWGDACASNKPHSARSTTQNPFRITLIAGTTADNFYVTMDCGARTQASKLGVIYSFTGPN